MSQIVNEALESYLSAGLVRNLAFTTDNKDEETEFPSLSEVVKRRPKM